MQQEQFKKEVVSLRGRLVAVACRILRDPDDAEDVVQETFCKLWSMRERLPEIQNIPGLSVRITKNGCLSRIRARKWINKGVEAEKQTIEDTTPYERLESQDSLDRTMRIIDSLPPLQQAVLRMKHLDGLEIQEIAELAGTTPEAVRVNLSRARRRVKEIFMKTEK